MICLYRRQIVKATILLCLFLLSFPAFSYAETVIKEVAGYSAENRPIEAYRYGLGSVPVILVGAIHGGYEWNTALLMEQFMDRLEREPDLVPQEVTLYIIPVMNPDGLMKVTGGSPVSEYDFSGKDTSPGRFNGNGVDLNRNWDFRWEPKAFWGTREVDPGTKPFSEPETRGVRDFVMGISPALVVFYHSAANGIYYGGRREGYEPGEEFARLYAEASGYRLPSGGSTRRGLVQYRITGAASNYFYSQGIPSITIELSTHSGTDFERNLKGLKAVLEGAAGRL